MPKGWESVGGQQREPLGKLVQWVAEEGNPKNKIIRFTFDKSVGDNEGVMYYSDYFPVEEGAKYRFQCRWKTNGPMVKVFIKCYDEMGTPYQKDSDEPADSTNRKSRARMNIFREAFSAAKYIEASRISKGQKMPGTSIPRISRPSTQNTRPNGAA